MKLLAAIFVAGMLSLAAGCTCNCDKEMRKAKKTYGTPEETTTYSSNGYDSRTYWWWAKGVSKSFTWGRHVSGCCDVSTYTFSPIYSAAEGVDADTVQCTLIGSEMEWQAFGW